MPSVRAHPVESDLEQQTPAPTQHSAVTSAYPHQRLAAQADRLDGAARTHINGWLSSDTLAQRPRSVLAIAACGYAASFANSAVRHVVLGARDAICVRGVGGAVRGVEVFIASGIDRVVPGRIALEADSATASAADAPAAHRSLSDLFHHGHFARSHAATPPPPSRGEVWSHRLVWPPRAGVEASACLVTVVAIGLGATVGTAVLVASSVVAAVVVTAVAYDTPSFFVWFVSEALRTGLKLMGEMDHLRHLLPTAHAVSAPRRGHRLMAATPQAPSLDEALTQLAVSTRSAQEAHSATEDADARAEVTDALHAIQQAIIGNRTLVSVLRVPSDAPTDGASQWPETGIVVETTDNAAQALPTAQT